eukprot:scaffold98300_cov26-Tisochrysis_lutea.AAC.1
MAQAQWHNNMETHSAWESPMQHDFRTLACKVADVAAEGMAAEATGCVTPSRRWAACSASCAAHGESHYPPVLRSPPTIVPDQRCVSLSDCVCLWLHNQGSQSLYLLVRKQSPKHTAQTCPTMKAHVRNHVE